MVLKISSWSCFCAWKMVSWLHCHWVDLLWPVWIFWKDFCSSPQAELGPPGGVTDSCLERSCLRMLVVHCLWREEG